MESRSGGGVSDSVQLKVENVLFSTGSLNERLSSSCPLLILVVYYESNVIILCIF